jgi:hypothetical protein
VTLRLTVNRPINAGSYHRFKISCFDFDLTILGILWFYELINLKTEIYWENAMKTVYDLDRFWTSTDHLRNRQNFDLNKSRQKFHYSLKEHHKISNIPKFRCEML